MIILKRFIVPLLLVYFVSCQTNRQSASAGNDSETNYVKAVTVSDPELDEVSGIAASRKYPNIFWLHNDSGDKARIFAINGQGQTIGQVLLQGVKAIDWEDIAIGPGPLADSSYIYVGDIGDNRARRDFKVIYRFPEPNVTALRNERHLTIERFAEIRFQLPDGARDSEALLCDPVSKNLYIVSKRESRVHLYELPYPQDTTQITQAEFLGQLPVTQITAGDIAPSGRHIMLKNYLQIFYFPRAKEQSVKQALSHFPSFLPYKEEPQGEALCFAPDENGYYTISEMRGGHQTQLYFYSYKFTQP